MVAGEFLSSMTSHGHHGLGRGLEDRQKRHLLRRARTAASLPGRVVACEDRTSAVEQHVVTKLDEMRSELAELRMLVRAQLDADADATELMGRLLQSADARLSALEQEQFFYPQNSLGPGDVSGSSTART